MTKKRKSSRKSYSNDEALSDVNATVRTGINAAVGVAVLGATLGTVGSLLKR